MPALNEELSLPHAAANVLSEFERFSLKGELLIVNDGSRDRTFEIAESLMNSNKNVKVLHHDSPLGIGAAFRDGLRVACGEIVVFIPGDGEIDAAEVFKNIHFMSEVDMVVPYMVNLELRSWHRRILSAIYQEIMSKTFSVSLKYLNGTVLYRRSILDGIIIRNPGFFYQAELLIKTINKKYSFVEVPYKMKRRVGGKSKFLSIRTLAQVVIGYAVLVHELYIRGDNSMVASPSSIASSKHG